MAKNLTGNIYGDLTVIRLTGISPKAVKDAHIWLCHCNRCGRNEEIRQSLLPHTPSLARKSNTRTACTVCTRGPCAICGGEIEADTYKGVCSEACFLERRRANDRAFHSRKAAADPSYYRKQNQAKQARIEADPVKSQQHRDKERQRSKERRDKDRELFNAQARTRYHSNQPAILAGRKARQDSMGEEERLAAELQQREYRRDYWQRKSTEITAQRQQKLDAMTPEERTQHIEQRRERNRQSYRDAKAQQALNDILQIGEELNDLDSKD